MRGEEAFELAANKSKGTKKMAFPWEYTCSE